jgi:hypothetical protein
MTTLSLQRGRTRPFSRTARHHSLQRRCRSHATLRAQRHHRNLDHNCRTQSSPASQIKFKALWIRDSRHAATFRAPGDGFDVLRDECRFCRFLLIVHALRFQSVSTLLRIRLRVYTFFGPPSHRHPRRAARSAPSCGTPANQTRTSPAPSVHSFLRGPQYHVTPANERGKRHDRSKIGQNWTKPPHNLTPASARQIIDPE